MSKNKIHLLGFDSSKREKYACNHAVKPRKEFMTDKFDKVTCQNCRKIIISFSKKVNYEIQEIKTGRFQNVSKPSLIFFFRKQIKYLRGKQRDLTLLLLFVAILGLLNLITIMMFWG